VLTAIANDQDFALIFVQQLRTLARAGDIAVGISTSGKARAWCVGSRRHVSSAS
jgi:phosphoheptose isomerase